MVSLPRLLQQPESDEKRFVLLRTPGRDCALSVDLVHAVSSVKRDQWQAMPGILNRIEAAEQILAEDRDLIVSLRMARLMSELPLPEATL